MTWKRTVTAALTLASLAAALAACTGATGPETPTRSTAASPTPTLAATTKPTSNRPTPAYDPDSPRERAKETVQNYFRVIDKCMQNPLEAKSTCFDSVAISTELGDLRNGLNSAKAASTKQIGTLEVVSTKLSKIDLTNKPQKTPPSIPTVTYAVCYDVSKVNIVDYRGKSIVPASRKSRAVVNVAVVNYGYPDPTQWRVGYLVSTGKSC